MKFPYLTGEVGNIGIAKIKKRGVDLPPDVWPALTWWIGGTVLAADCEIAYQPLYAPTLAASYTNIANPGTHNAAPLATPPGWDIANGWIGDGTDKRLTTGYTPANTNHSMLLQYKSLAVGGQGAGLDDSGNRRFYVWPRFNANQVVYAEGNLAIVNNSTNAGNMAISGQRGYFDGVADGGAIGGWSGSPARAIYLNGSNPAGGAGGSNYFNGYTYLFALYNRTLTPAEVSLIAAQMAAVLTGGATIIPVTDSSMIWSPSNWRQA